MYLHDSEVQGNGHEGLFTAGQQCDGFQLLAGGLHLDLDTAAQNVVLILQLQPGLAAAEQLQKGLLKAIVEPMELLGEDLRHLAGDLVNDPRQLLLGLLHVRSLLGEVGIAGVHPVELLDGPDVGSAEALDLPVQLPDAAGGLGDALQLHALALSLGVAQFIPLPQLIQNILLLHGGGVFLLLQPGHLTLRVEDLLIAALHLLILLGAAALQLQLLRRQRCQLLLQLAASGPQLFRLLPMDIHLPAGFLIGPTEPLQQRLPPGPVGMHLGLQTLQLPAAVE